MTEKSNELSGKDKVTQASEEEAKGIENANSAEKPEAEAGSEDAAIEKVDAESQTESAGADETPSEEVVAEGQTEEGTVLASAAEETVSGDEATPAEAAEVAESAGEETVSASEVKADGEKEEAEEEEDSADEHVDLTGLTKIQLLKLLKDKIHHVPILKLDKLAHEIKAAFDELVAKDKEEALGKFKAEGGLEDDFEYRQHDEEREFLKVFNDFRYQINSLRKEAERQKEKNLTAKNELLNKLRDLVDGEETTASMGAIKAIQEEWKSIGPVPTAQNRNLWASFNALMDRFYDARSIYFELKELDRKKNLESKTELCEKAEQLKDVKELKEAIRQLNELHEEFKHIGPVPREDQEVLWQRFKAASDAVYDRRKEFFEGQKEVYKKNQTDKEELIAQLAPFAEFKADRIKEWNTKTKEILDIQKAWEKIGPVPKEAGKDTNKAFWAAFKHFFHNKNLFFKELDEIRATNQKRAEELIEQAEALKDNTDWQNTANQLVKLQQDWKKLGPTPEKNRDSLYKRFKAACDAFFENRRSSSKQAHTEFDQNLKKKQDLIKTIVDASEGEGLTEEALKTWVSEFNEIGFVPRKNIKEIQAQFKEAVDKYLEKLDSTGTDREDFLFRLNLDRIQSDPNAIKTLNKKEHGIRKQIADLENNITLWKNNLEFFTASKTADKLKDQFDVKIQKAEEEIDKLKKKLNILKEF
jgi:peptidase E